jgi:hypothetical protein
MPESSKMLGQGLLPGKQVLFMIFVFMLTISDMIKRRFFSTGLSPYIDSLSVYIVVSKFFVFSLLL